MRVEAGEVGGRARPDVDQRALDRELGSTASWSRPTGGYFVWLDLPDGTDAADLLERATAAGVTFVRGSDFFPGGADGRSAARLAYSFESPERLGEGVGLLADLLR